MNRKWHFTKTFYEFRLGFAIYFDFPNDEDYYDSQFDFRLELFGLNINIGTWKEQYGFKIV